MALHFADCAKLARAITLRPPNSKRACGTMKELTPHLCRTEVHTPKTRRLTILYHHRTRSRDGQSVHIDALISALRTAGHRIVVVGPRQIPAKQESLNRRLLPKSIYELFEIGYNVIELLKLASVIVRYRPDALYQRANLFM